MAARHNLIHDESSYGAASRTPRRSGISLHGRSPLAPTRVSPLAQTINTMGVATIPPIFQNFQMAHYRRSSTKQSPFLHHITVVIFKDRKHSNLQVWTRYSNVITLIDEVHRRGLSGLRFTLLSSSWSGG